jgi:hypothetical protein
LSPERTQPRSSHTEDSQPSAFEEEREAVLRLAAELASVTDAAEASAVVEKLSARLAQLPGDHPKEAVQSLLRRLLDDPSFGRHLDARGEPLRRAVVEANQRLGYPWALELHPDDVQHAAAIPFQADRAAQAAALTMVAAVGSALWNGLWLNARLSVWEEDPNSFVIAMFGVGTLHAVLAFAAAAWSFRDKEPGLLRWLGRAIALGPAASLAVMAIDPGSFHPAVFIATMIAAAPAMATAAGCAWTASALKKKP